MGEPGRLSNLDVVSQSDISALNDLEAAAAQLRDTLERRIANGARVEPGPLRWQEKKNAKAVSLSDG